MYSDKLKKSIGRVHRSKIAYTKYLSTEKENNLKRK